MGTAVFIGDEVTAAGFRLAGVESVVSDPKDAAKSLKVASKNATLVIMTSDLARAVPVQELELALLAEKPALAIIPDVRMRAPMPDLAERLRRVLGIDE